MLMPILSDKGLRQLLDSGHVSVMPSPKELQPASIDFELGRAVVFDRAAQSKGAEFMSDCGVEPGLRFGKIVPPGKPVYVPSGAHLEVRFDGLRVGRNVSWFVDCRSSYGRLGFRPYRYVPEYYDDGHAYMAIRNNNPNDVVLPAGDRFAQGFFSCRRFSGFAGWPIFDPAKARKILDELGADLELDGPFVRFHAGPVVRRFRRDIGPIDRSKEYSDDDLYLTYKLADNVVFEPGQCSLVPSRERLELSDKVGILLCRNLPPDKVDIDIVDTRVNAGWIDPGYEGNVTLTPFDHTMPLRIRPGQPLAWGLLYYFTQGCERKYGECGNRYNKSEGIGFKP